MNLLASKKTSYLLDMGIEILHEQSQEWLSEIAFWRDETNFFYSLIIGKTLKSIPTDVKSGVKKIENSLISITVDELDKLQEDVEKHEKFLNYIMLTKSNEEESYRQKHRELSQTITKFEKKFKSVKKEVFDLAKQIKKENKKE